MDDASPLESRSLVPDEFSLNEYIESGAFGFGEDGRQIKVVLQFNEEVAYHLNETALSEDQVIRDVPDREGWIELMAHVNDTAQLKWWLLGFGQYVEIIKPKGLRDEFRQIVSEMNALYEE